MTNFADRVTGAWKTRCKGVGWPNHRKENGSFVTEYMTLNLSCRTQRARGWKKPSWRNWWKKIAPLRWNWRNKNKRFSSSSFLFYYLRVIVLRRRSWTKSAIYAMRSWSKSPSWRSARRKRCSLSANKIRWCAHSGSTIGCRRSVSRKSARTSDRSTGD